MTQPHYNTISTIIRILEDKGVVGHQSFGNSHQYYPLITKEHYQENAVGDLLEKYFDNSYQKMVAYFAKEEKIRKWGININADELIKSGIHNIDAEYIKELEYLGFVQLSVEEIVKASIHDVDTKFIEKARKEGKNYEKLEDYIDLKLRTNTQRIYREE